MIAEQIRNRPFCIYGAGIVASSVYTAVKELYHKKPLFFLVSDDRKQKQGKEPDGEMEEIDGIAVKGLSAWLDELRSRTAALAMPYYYLVAVPEAHHASIVQTLRLLGFPSIEPSQIILVTNALENALMEKYFGAFLKQNTVAGLLAGKEHLDRTEYRIGKAGQSEVSKQEGMVQVFQAKCHKDRPLQHVWDGRADSGQQTVPSYICPVQAGAALTDRIIAGEQDNGGDNISAKNGNYSELTVTYYGWRNSHAAYKGICHYRRIFDISEEQMQALLTKQSAWDVILPYPTVHYPNIASQHLRYLNEGDWDSLLQALQEEAPAYFEAYQQMLSRGEKYFYNFNMLLARSEVFDDYCSFLFRVLARAEALVTPKGWERADRFAGYMGENLTTIYFLKNRDKLKIIYAGKLWLT